MPQLVNLFLVISGVIVVGLGVVGVRDHPAVAIFPLTLGIAMVVLAYVSDRRRTRRVDERKRVAVQQRTDALTRRAAGSAQSLQISSGILTAVVGPMVAAMGAAALSMDVTSTNHDAILLVVGVFSLALGLLISARTLPAIGQPILEINMTGFATPLNGKIAWRDVSGIHLRTLATRNGSESFTLLFRVPQFARVVRRVHWTDRLTGLFGLGPLVKGVVGIGLFSSKEPPAAVYALARLLWKQSTGNDYAWNPAMSDEYNDAMRRTEAWAASFEKPEASETAMADPEQLSISIAQMESDTALIAAESKRRLSGK